MLDFFHCNPILTEIDCVIGNWRSGASKGEGITPIRERTQEEKENDLKEAAKLAAIMMGRSFSESNSESEEEKEPESEKE